MGWIISRDTRHILNKSKMIICHIRYLVCPWNSALRMYSIKSVHDKLRKISNQRYKLFKKSEKKHKQNKHKETRIKRNPWNSKQKKKEKMKKTESCLFEMINNIDKLLARLTKRKKVHVINIKNERDDTTSQH